MFIIVPTAESVHDATCKHALNVQFLPQPDTAREDFDIEEAGDHGHEYRPAVSWAILKVLYFLSGISASTWGRFGTIFYNEHGLSMLLLSLHWM